MKNLLFLSMMVLFCCMPDVQAQSVPDETLFKLAELITQQQATTSAAVDLLTEKKLSPKEFNTLLVKQDHSSYLEQEVREELMHCNNDVANKLLTAQRRTGGLQLHALAVTSYKLRDQQAPDNVTSIMLSIIEVEQECQQQYDEVAFFVDQDIYVAQRSLVSLASQMNELDSLYESAKVLIDMCRPMAQTAVQKPDATVAGQYVVIVCLGRHLDAAHQSAKKAYNAYVAECFRRESGGEITPTKNE